MPEIRARFPERQLWLYILGGEAPDLLGTLRSLGFPVLETGAVEPRAISMASRSRSPVDLLAVVQRE